MTIALDAFVHDADHQCAGHHFSLREVEGRCTNKCSHKGCEYRCVKKRAKATSHKCSCLDHLPGCKGMCAHTDCKRRCGKPIWHQKTTKLHSSVSRWLPERPKKRTGLLDFDQLFDEQDPCDCLEAHTSSPPQPTGFIKIRHLHRVYGKNTHANTPWPTGGILQPKAFAPQKDFNFYRHRYNNPRVVVREGSETSQHWLSKLPTEDYFSRASSLACAGEVTKDPLRPAAP